MDAFINAKADTEVKNCPRRQQKGVKGKKKILIWVVSPSSLAALLFFDLTQMVQTLSNASYNMD